MELADLESLIAVSRAGSMVGAAAETKAARSRLVRAIERLEAEVGGPLVVTEPSGTRLTRIGRRLVQGAEPLLQAAEGWRQRIEAVRDR